MDIDGAIVNAPSTKEKQQLVKEGKYFTCKRTRHQSCNYLNRVNASRVTNSGICMNQGMSAHTAKIGEKKEDKKKVLTESIQTMTAEE